MLQNRDIRSARRVLASVALIATIIAAGPSPARAADACQIGASEEVQVARIIDGRTIRIADGRMIRLAGIELPSSPTAREQARSALSDIAANRVVTLFGASYDPDRYGRQLAFAALPEGEATIQTLLLAEGAVLASGTLPKTGCTGELHAAEARARQARSGVWAGNVIKNAESPGDILAAIGHFGLIEGKVRSVRQAGSMTYVNFGPRWTRDFAVTIPKRALPFFEQAGLPLKSLANRRIRVRGWVQRRGGPRMEITRPWQIELLERNKGTAARRTTSGPAKP